MASEKVDGNDSAQAKGSQDPEVLAKEIERTREDLAETFDAIADKVSPKRVAQRTTESVKATVKEKAGQAREVLGEKAGQAKEAAGHAKDAVAEKAASARTAVQERTSSAGEPALPVAAEPEPGVDPLLPSTAGVEVPVLSPKPVPTYGPDAYSTTPAVPKEALIGGVVGLLVLLLVWRRRR